MTWRLLASANLRDDQLQKFWFFNHEQGLPRYVLAAAPRLVLEVFKTILAKPRGYVILVLQNLVNVAFKTLGFFRLLRPPPHRQDYEHGNRVLHGFSCLQEVAVENGFGTAPT